MLVKCPYISHYIINLASSIEIILFFVGVALLLLEIFVIPGFGFAGIAGIASIIAGIYLSLVGALENVTWSDLGDAAYRLGLTLLVTIGGAMLLARYGPRTTIWRKLSLPDEQKRDEGYVASKDYRSYIGKVGTAITPLRPAGMGLFGDERLDVVTEGEFIENNSPIKIIGVEGYRLVVRETKGLLK